MRQAGVPPRVLGYLGRALTYELSAVQLYMTQARLVETWGMSEAAAQLRQESVEEMKHADLIIGRMLELGAAPGGSQLRPAAVGNSLESMLIQDARFESELVAFYREAVRECRLMGNQAQQDFFNRLLSEESAHADGLQRWIQQVQTAEAGSA